MLVIRTRKRFWRSRPGKYLLLGTVAVGAATIVLPYTPVGGLLGFVPIPLPILFVLGGIAVAYAGSSEVAKYVFYRRVQG
jgi:Mg2+-importing ATPase